MLTKLLVYRRDDGHRFVYIVHEGADHKLPFALLGQVTDPDLPFTADEAKLVEERFKRIHSIREDTAGE